jgi:hypothetical protein
MPQVGFEPMTPVFERAKTVHVLDRAATVIGTRPTYEKVMNRKNGADSRHNFFLCIATEFKWQPWKLRKITVSVSSLWAEKIPSASQTYFGDTYH